MRQHRPRVLLFSTLYPSSVRPSHGMFVETRLRRLLDTGEVQARVVAPVPWFYSTDSRHGVHALMARTPRKESHHGIEVHHPRYLLPPRVGQNVAPFLLALGALGTLQRLRSDGFDFDLIDAHYYYPDGVAAAFLGRMLDRPVTITARGSDLNVLGNYPFARRLMRWAAGRASASICVCTALADILRGWGVPDDRLKVWRNGVDLTQFHPIDLAHARAELGVEDGPVLLSVGNLLEVKGIDLTLRAVALMRAEHPRLRFVIVGDGPLRSRLQSLADELGIADRVRFAGHVANERLAAWYSAADVSILASHSEGWANVLLESMACGTPVVATNVGGSAEVIGEGPGGRLVHGRDPEAIAGTVRQVLHDRPPRLEVRRYAEGFSWDLTSQAQVALFRELATSSGCTSNNATT